MKEGVVENGERSVERKTLGNAECDESVWRGA
jgi:hypothetical protein